MHDRTPLPWSRPALVAALIALATLITPGVTAQKAEPRVIEVVATRWKFEPAQIEATVGEPLRLVVSSGDGVHGIEIKKFRVKKEIPRGGDPVMIHFTPDSAGQFPILCSEYCGDGHQDMKGMLVVAARDKD
jgi:cytochrome c oxidase subunit II